VTSDDFLLENYLTSSLLNLHIGYE